VSIAHVPRAARKHRVREVARQHLAAVELAVEIHERIAGGDLRLLDRLHEREALVELELADRVAQEVVRAELVVGVASLDVLHRRELTEHPLERRVEIAGFGRPVPSGSVPGRRLVIDDSQAVQCGRELGIVRVVGHNDV
jgi:hypothetical protein